MSTEARTTKHGQRDRRAVAKHCSLIGAAIAVIALALSGCGSDGGTTQAKKPSDGGQVITVQDTPAQGLSHKPDPTPTPGEAEQALNRTESYGPHKATSFCARSVGENKFLFWTCVVKIHPAQEGFDADAVCQLPAPSASGHLSSDGCSPLQYVGQWYPHCKTHDDRAACLGYGVAWVNRCARGAARSQCEREIYGRFRAAA